MKTCIPALLPRALISGFQTFTKFHGEAITLFWSRLPGKRELRVFVTLRGSLPDSA
jgi:hypothetical protein